MAGETRKIVVDALHRATGALNDAALSDRLKDPAGDVRLDELRLDSLSAIDWCMEIETATGLELDPADLGRRRTLTELVAHVEAGLAAR